MVSACAQTTDFPTDNGGDDDNGDVIEGTANEAFPNLLFNRPLTVQHADDGSCRLFVV